MWKNYKFGSNAKFRCNDGSMFSETRNLEIYILRIYLIICDILISQYNIGLPVYTLPNRWWQIDDKLISFTVILSSAGWRYLKFEHS